MLMPALKLIRPGLAVASDCVQSIVDAGQGGGSGAPGASGASGVSDAQWSDPSGAFDAS